MMTPRKNLSSLSGRSLIVVGILGLWWCITSSHLVSSVLLPAPTDVWIAMLNLFRFGYNGTPLAALFAHTDTSGSCRQ